MAGHRRAKKVRKTKSQNRKKTKSSRKRSFQSKRPIAMTPELSKALLKEINKIRRREGLRELEWDKRLYKWAVWWAKRMYKGNWYGHVNPKTGKALYQEKKMVLGECLCKIPNKRHRPSFRGGKKAIEAWLWSSGHRRLLLISKKDYTGAAIGAYGNIYVFLITNYYPL